MSIDDVAKEKDGTYIYKENVIKTNNQSIEDIVIDKMMEIYYKDIVIKMLDTLNDRDKEIFKLTYGFADGKVYTQEEIARKIGISRGTVSVILIKNLRKMRERIIFEEKRNNLCRNKKILQ